MSRFVFLFSKQHHHRLWSLAIPMILSNISVPLLGLIDTAMVGHLSAAHYLAAVALGSTIITLISWLLGFLRMATTGLTAQALGKQDPQVQCQYLMQASFIAITLGLLLVTLQQPIIDASMWLANTSEQVELYCRQYVGIRIWSLPIVLMNLVMLGWLLGRRLPKVTMWQLIIANSVNIILDAWFILGLGWQVKGAAWASVLADFSAFLIAFYFTKQQLRQLGFWQHNKLVYLIFQKGYQQLISLNANIFIRSLCLQSTFAFMTFYAAGINAVTLAANAVLLNILMLISYGLDGIAYYAEVEVGQHYGSKNEAALKQSVFFSWFWSGIIAVGFTLLFGLSGERLISMLTDISEVITAANEFLPWLILLPLWSFSCYLFDGVYIGAAKGNVMRNSMLFSTGLFFILWFVIQAWGNHALWAALSVFMLSRSATLAGHFWLYLRQQSSTL
ncbi:MAG: MATE family efflux transporter [Parashewanella sp.]